MGLLVLRSPDGAQKCQVRVDKASGMDKAINLMIKCAEAAMAGSDRMKFATKSLASSQTASPNEQPNSDARCELQMSDMEEAALSMSTRKRPATRTCCVTDLSQKPEANTKTKGSSLDMAVDFTELPF